ncbi:MAG: LysR family transcriptional regulator [Beijerinckiaceae bacterium]
MALSSARDIELVRALAEHRHFGRAAAALGVSQPVVSRSLAQLEAEIGETLIERSTMRPTAFGRIILRLGDRILGGFAEIRREIALQKGLEIGDLAVAMGPYPAAISGYKAAARLSQRHPGLAIDLRPVDWLEALEATLDGSIELAFADLTEVGASPDLQIEPVRQQSVHFVCRAGHPLTLHETPSVEQISQYPWVAPTIPRSGAAELPAGEMPAGVVEPDRRRFRPRIIVETFLAMKEIAISSDAIFAAARFQVEDEIRSGKLVALREAPFVRLNYGFIWRNGGTLSPAAKAFMQHVRDIEAEHPVTSSPSGE